MFHNLSIRLKLIVLLGASAALALLVSSGLTFYLTYSAQKMESLRVLGQLADVSAENLRAALAFRDADSAARLLAPLRANPHILLARLDDEDGRLFGRFVASSLSEAGAQRLQAGLVLVGASYERMTPEFMVVGKPIVFEGKPIGFLTIVSDTDEMWRQLREYVASQLLVSLVALLVLIALSIPLQRVFTGPILALLDAMRRVARTKDYAQDLSYRGKDEFHDLYQGFNAMLAEIHARDEQLSRLATTDALTGLANRREAMDTMATMVGRAWRKREPIGVITLDIDHFKSINDSHGHPVGDRVIAAVAHVLSGCAREYDLVARVGGEEFLVLCDNSDRETTLAVAERIRVSVEEARIELDGGESIGVTVSIGAHAAVPESQVSDGLLRTVDAALYRAKGRGRNTVEMEGES